MLAVLSFIAGGVATWLTTTFIGNPIASFLAARQEVMRVLDLYQDHDRYNPDAEELGEWKGADVDRRRELATASAQLAAFAKSNQLLDRFVLRKLGFLPDHAAQSLRLLGQMNSSGPNNDDQRSAVLRYLLLGRQFGRKRIG